MTRGPDPAQGESNVQHLVISMIRPSGAIMWQSFNAHHTYYRQTITAHFFTLTCLTDSVGCPAKRAPRATALQNAHVEGADALQSSSLSNPSFRSNFSGDNQRRPSFSWLKAKESATRFGFFVTDIIRTMVSRISLSIRNKAKRTLYVTPLPSSVRRDAQLRKYTHE